MQQSEKKLNYGILKLLCAYLALMIQILIQLCTKPLMKVSQRIRTKLGMLTRQRKFNMY